MKTSGCVRAAAVIVLALSLAGGPRIVAQSRDQAGPAAGTLSLSGRVVLNDGAPDSVIRRARVTLTGDTLPSQIADTDTDGTFQFERLPAGTFRILAEKPGFIMVERGPARGVVKPISVTLSESGPKTLTVQMQRAAAIEGQLLSEKGGPAANVVVSAVRLVYGPYGRRPSAVRQAITDDLGRFRLHTLPSGDYYLEAAPDPLVGVTTAVPADRQGLARSYFPGTARVEDARIVTLAPSQELSGVDFRIAAVRLSVLSGKVVDASGQAPSALGVRLQRMGAPPGEFRALSARAGEFQFPAVPPGEYWLLATARSSPAAETEYASQRVIVGGEDLKDLTLTTAKAAAAIGRVEVESSAALPPNLQVVVPEVQFEMPSLQPAPPAVLPAPGTVAADGTFALPGLFGHRLFRVDRLPANWGLKSVLLDGVDVTDTPVDFIASSPQTRALRLVVTNRTASVSGSLEAPTGGPASGRILVFADDARRWGIRSRMIKTVEVREDGRYTVTGLLAGRYYILGTDDMNDGAWLDPELLGRLQAMATPLVIGESQRITLTLLKR